MGYSDGVFSPHQMKMMMMSSEQINSLLGTEVAGTDLGEITTFGIIIKIYFTFDFLLKDITMRQALIDQQANSAATAIFSEDMLDTVDENFNTLSNKMPECVGKKRPRDGRILQRYDSRTAIKLLTC